MESLDTNEVYSIKPGRRLAEDDTPVADSISVGRAILQWGSTTPLDDYNKTFKKLQRRRRLPPIRGISLYHSETVQQEVRMGARTESSDSTSVRPELRASLQERDSEDLESDSDDEDEERDAGSRCPEDEVYARAIQGDDDVQLDSDMEDEDDGRGRDGQSEPEDELQCESEGEDDL